MAKKYKQSLRQTTLVHDIRHCLHAMRMGRETLAKMYGDEQIQEVCALMELEEQKVVLLLDELFESVKERTAPDSSKEGNGFNPPEEHA